MKFKYHQPIPNFYKIKNPEKPKTTISQNILDEFHQIAKDLGFVGISYAKLSDEFKSQWEIDWDNIVILKYAMSEDILKMDPSREKCKKQDMEFQEFAFKTFELADFLRDNSFRADLLNPLDDRVSMRSVAMQSNDAVITRNNMCMFREGVNLGFFMIQTSVENLPFKKENELAWVNDFCSTCGVCIDRCPENAFDENGNVLRKVCTAHKEGCSICLTICPFYKRGYDKVKKRYDRQKR